MHDTSSTIRFKIDNAVPHPMVVPNREITFLVVVRIDVFGTQNWRLKGLEDSADLSQVCDGGDFSFWRALQQQPQGALAVDHQRLLSGLQVEMG